MTGGREAAGRRDGWEGVDEGEKERDVLETEPCWYLLLFCVCVCSLFNRSPSLCFHMFISWTMLKTIGRICSAISAACQDMNPSSERMFY